MEKNKSARQGKNWVSDAFKNPLAILGLIYIAILILAAILVPSIRDISYTTTHLDLKSLPPTMRIYRIDDDRNVYLHKEFHLIETTSDGRIIGRLEGEKNDLANRRYLYDLEDSEVVVDYDMKEEGSQVEILVDGQRVEDSKLVWNKTFPLGTDILGRDYLSRLAQASKNSLIIVFFAAILNAIIGLAIGSIAGYFGGTVDTVLMRIVDAVATIPSMVITILILAVFGNSLLVMIITMGISNWVRIARVIRNQVLSVRNSEFIEASISMNATSSWIIRKHLIPNVMPHFITCITMVIPTIVFSESTLGFIGLGLNPPEPSIGLMISEGLEVMRTHPYQLIIPSLILILLVLSCNLIGRSLQASLSIDGRK